MSLVRVHWPDVAFLHPIPELPNCDSMWWSDVTGQRQQLVPGCWWWWCGVASSQLTVQQHHHRLVLYTATALTHLFRLFGLHWEGLVTVARCRAQPNIDKALALTLLLPLHEPIMYILHEYCSVQLALCRIFITSILIKHHLEWLANG